MICAVGDVFRVIPGECAISFSELFYVRNLHLSNTEKHDNYNTFVCIESASHGLLTVNSSRINTDASRVNKTIKISTWTGF